MWPLTVREVIEACDARCGPGCRSSCGASCRALVAAAGEVLVRGATGSLSDLAEGDLFVALPFVNGDAHARVEQALSFGAALALVSEAWPGLGALPPGLRRRCGVVPDVTAAFRRFAAAFRARLACPVLAVAGSNGKTTTKEMLAALLSSPGRRVVKTPGTDNGFLGLPQTLCARAHRASAPADAAVLEIGIDAPGAMAQHARMVAPDVAVITALGPEHLGGLGDVATAVREELELLACAPGARRVLPLDDPEIRARPGLLRRGDVAVVEGEPPSEVPAWLAEGVSVMVYRARLSGAESTVEMCFRGEGGPGGEEGSAGAGEEGSAGRGEKGSAGRGEKGSAGRGEEGSAGEERSAGFAARGPGERRIELRCPLPGRHNARDLALAVAAALLAGRFPEELRAGWRTFEAPPGRSRVSALARGALLHDDSFNASPLSMDAALDGIEDARWAGRPRVLVLGDMLDLGAESERWHLALAERLSGMEGARAFLFGPAMGAVAGHLRSAGRGVEIAGYREEGDPVDLVRGLDLPENAVVLVKGSRGMRMERVAQYLARRWPAEGGARGGGVSPGPGAGSRAIGGAPDSLSLPPDRPPGARDTVPVAIAVTGAGRAAAARAIAAALRCLGPVVVRAGGTGVLAGEALTGVLAGEALTGVLAGEALTGVLAGEVPAERAAPGGKAHAVISMCHEEILPTARRARFEVVVFTGLGDGDLPPGVDPETHLAHVAQLLVGDNPPRALVMPAPDATCDLLAEVAPEGTRVLRHRGAGGGGEGGYRGAGASGGEGGEGGPRGHDEAAAAVATSVVIALGGADDAAAAHLQAMFRGGGFSP